MNLITYHSSIKNAENNVKGTQKVLSTVFATSYESSYFKIKSSLKSTKIFKTKTLTYMPKKDIIKSDLKVPSCTPVSFTS
jgi:hypothetical protein